MSPVLEVALKQAYEVLKKYPKREEKVWEEFDRLKEWERLCASTQSG